MKNKLHVLITGASSGIGKTCATFLSKQGFRVFAGVRNSNDGETLIEETSGNVIPLFLDVTEASSITTAVEKISDITKNKLFALINNAGVALGGPLEILSESDIRKLIEVNVVGVLAITKAFIPLLRNNGEGRIVNIGSMTSFFALPGFSVYSSSKHALKAITDSLRVELLPFNIQVSMIATGRVETPIWEKGLLFADKMLREGKDEILKLYEPMINYLQEYARNPSGISPDQVARKVLRILTANKTKSQYLLGKDARILNLISKLPDNLRGRMLLLSLPRK
jgi:NAD(P)-dependent dehydrogenase (short-subunit alcohol dehydrogenase family)